MPVANKSNELKIIRIFNAPVDVVWDAWVEEDQVAQWWGPRGFSITNISKDVRTGGHWKYTMHGPDGTDYPNLARYLEVVPKSKMIYEHGGTENTPPLFTVTVLFTPSGNKTKMDMTMTFASAEAAESTRKFVKQLGGESCWDRLSEYAEKKTSGTDKFVINRSFDASIDLVFDMWTNPEHFAKWMGPKGATLNFQRADIKSGGSSFYSISMGPGMQMYGRAEYIEVRKPNRITYLQQFCDENENVSRHPMSPTFPLTVLSTVDLTEEGLNRTRVTVTWECFGDFTAEELATLIAERNGMTQGWNGSFDKLDDKLADELASNA